MAGEHVVYGDFFGLFKTDQDLPLGSTAVFPTDLKHKVQVYQGKITNTTFEHEFKPEKHRILKSFVLSGASNIEIEGNAKAPFADSRVYDFTQLMIIDPKIERVFSMNNGTYGEISGKVYGTSANRPRISKLDPLSPPPKTDEPGNGNNGDNNPTGSTGFNDDSEIGKIFETSKEGCLSAWTGCIANIWRILWFLLLLLFLWWLIRSCNNVINDTSACDRKDKTYKELKDEDKKNKKLRRQYEQRIEEFIKKNQNIFFYKNSSKKTLISQKQNTIRNWVKLIKTCKEKKFKIIGHHAGISIEEKYYDIDLRRAKRIKYELIKLGVKREQILCLGMEDKEKKYSSQIRKIQIGKKIRYYNGNMRVEIKVNK